MGWSYRKSVGLGPFRVNLSKGGVGFSVGGPGFRTGVNSRGRRYTSFSLPGTGLRYQTSGKGGAQGCAGLVLLAFGLSAAGFAAAANYWLGN